MANEGIELRAYSYSDPTQLVDIIPLRIAPQALEEFDKVGVGKVTLPESARNSAATEYRNYIKVLVDGVTRAGFVVQEKNDTIISKSEYSGKASVVTGEGPMTWFNDARVLPEKGLISGSFDNRSFNFATARGPWYQASDWATPYNIRRQDDQSSHSWKNLPPEWPDGAGGAYWMWSVAPVVVPGPHTSGNHPRGVNYFRREFTTTAPGKYKIFLTADDKFEAYVDGQKIAVGGPHSQTFTIEIELEAGTHVFGAKVTNVGFLGAAQAGPAGLLMAMYTYSETEPNNASQIVFASGGPNWQSATYGKTPGWTAGDVLIQLLTEAYNRNVKFAGWLNRNFTGTTDSNGVAWKRELSWDFKVGTDSYMTVIEKLQESGVSVWIDPDTLQLNAVQTRGIDKSQGDNTVVLYEGNTLTKATVENRADIKNRLLVRNNEGWNVQVDTASVSKYGVIEDKMEFDLSNVESTKYSNEFLRLRATPEESAEYELIAKPGATPWVDFKVGDWVRVVTSSGTKKRQIVSISVSEGEAGEVEYSVEFDTIFLSREQKLQKTVEKLQNVTGVGQLSTGGKVTTNSPSLGGTPLVMPNPVTNLTYITEGYWTESGEASGLVKLTWTAPTLNDDGSPSSGLSYEVWGERSDVPVPTPQRFAVVDTTFATVMNLTPKTNWRFKIRTVNAKGTVAPFVSTPAFLVPFPLVKLDPPTKPVLTDKLMILSASWDGLLAQGANTIATPNHFHHVSAYVSSTQNGTYILAGSDIVAKGTIHISGQAANTPVWVKFKAFDILGNESEFSQPQSITMIDTIQQKLDEAATNLEDAINSLDDEISTISGSVITSTVAPTLADGQDKRVDTFWYQIIDGVLKDTWRWTGTAWAPMEWGNVSQIELEQLSDALKLKIETAVTDSGIAKSDAASANGRVTSSASTPTAANGTGKPTGAMWYQYNTQGDILGTWRWNGTAWDKLAISKDALAASINTDIQNAVDKANSAQTTATSANGKVTTSPNVPTAGDGAGKPNGAIWYRNTGGETVATYTWNGTAWQEQKVSAGSLAQTVHDTIAAADLKGVNAAIDAAKAAAKAQSLMDSAQNRVSDPSFSGGEYPTSGVWYVDTAVGAGRTDNFALRNDAGPSPTSVNLTRNISGGMKSVPVEVDQVWELSGWYRTTSNWNGTSGNSNLRLAAQNSSPVSLNLPITAPMTTWTYMSGRYKIPSGGSITGLQLTIASNNTAGSVWWDDISLKEVTLAAKAEEDARLAKKAADDSAIAAELNGKKSTVSTSTPPSSAADYPDGAIWYQVNGTRDVIGMWSKAIGGAGTWVKGVVTNDVVGNLTAGKITTGTLGADRIGANSISTTKMMIGDFEDLFEDRSLAHTAAWTGSFTLTPRSAPNQAANMLRMNSGTSTIDVYSTKIVDVVGGEKIAVYGQVFSEASASGPIWIGARVTLTSGAYQYPNVVKTITTGAGTDTIEGIITLPASAVKVQLFLSIRSEFTDNQVVNWHSLSAKFQKGATLIENGAITTDKIVAGGIDAKVMTTGTLDAARIGANSISTRQLLVGNFDNLLEDPSFMESDLSKAWRATTGTLASWIVASSSTAGVPAKALRANGTGVAQRLANRARVSSYEGDRFSLSARVNTNLTGGILQIGLVYRNNAGAYLAATYFDIPSGGGWKNVAFTTPEAGAPNGTERVDFEILIPAEATGGALLIGNMSFRRSVGATLIEDGAITTNHIKTGTFTATSGVIESLNAGVITAGFIKPAVIEAGSIGAEKLVITNFTNLIEDPLYAKTLEEQWVATEGSLASWIIMSPATITAKALRVTASSVAQRLRNRNRIAVRTGAKYALSVRCNNQTNGVVYLRVTWRNAGFGVVGNSRIPIPVNAEWRDSTFISDPAPETAVWADFEFEIPLTVTSGMAYFAEPEWRQSVGATVIENGTITSEMISGDKIKGNVIVAGTITADELGENSVTPVQIANLAVTNAKVKDLDAAKVTTGYLDAARIKANTIDASKLLVGDFLNYIPDSEFESISTFGDNPATHANPANGTWYRRSGATSATNVITDTGGPGRAWKLDGVGGEVSVMTTNVARQKVVGGTKYQFTARYLNSLTGSSPIAYVRLVWYTSTNVQITPPTSISIPVVSSWTSLNEEVTAPANAFFVRVMFIHGSNNTGGSWWIVNPNLRAKTPSVLIEDGAITASKITASEEILTALLKTKKVEAQYIEVGQIKSVMLDANSITSEMITSTGQIIGKSFVGSDFNTSTTGSGARVVIEGKNPTNNNNGVTVFNASNQSQVRLGYGIGTGMEVRNPVNNQMTPLAQHIFGTFTSSGASGSAEWQPGWDHAIRLLPSGATVTSVSGRMLVIGNISYTLRANTFLQFNLRAYNTSNPQTTTDFLPIHRTLVTGYPSGWNQGNGIVMGILELPVGQSRVIGVDAHAKVPNENTNSGPSVAGFQGFFAIPI